MKNYGTLIKKIITDKNGHKRTVYVSPKGNIGIKRKDMPQVTGDNHEAYIKWLNGLGVKTKKGSTEVHSLKATQKEINNQKVKDMIASAKKTGETRWLKRTIIISSDNHILDGHHRWAALMRMEGEQKMDTLQVDKPIKELLELTRKFPKVEKRRVNEPPKNKNQKTLALQ